jgi:hypothetical protein
MVLLDSPAPGKRTAVIVDTDAGMDDLAAVTLLAGENVAVKLITTTCGICRPGTGFDSMQRIVNAAGLKTRVVAGAEDRRPVPHGAWEFGQHSLLAALCSTLGPPGPFQRPSADAAADAILHTLREEESGTVTILSMGGMTNLGLAARRDPATFKKVQRIVFVGGVRGPPGYHQRPYNAWLDPDALRHVINSGVQLVLIGKGCYASLAWCLTHGPHPWDPALTPHGTVPTHPMGPRPHTPWDRAHSPHGTPPSHPMGPRPHTPWDRAHSPPVAAWPAGASTSLRGPTCPQRVRPSAPGCSGASCRCLPMGPRRHSHPMGMGPRAH